MDLIRTYLEAEIYMVIRMPSSEIWAVEIKYGSAPKLGRHYSAICDDVGATRKYVIYGGYCATIILSGPRQLSWPVFLY